MSGWEAAWLVTGFAIGSVVTNLIYGTARNRDDVLARRRQRWVRKRQGRLLWWLLPPGWRYRR
jgi:hypothetical protein